MKNTGSGIKMSEDSHSTEVPTIIICQCCEYQFNPQIEECCQDIHIGYVCKDCFIKLKWSSARLKLGGMSYCSKFHNNRIKDLQ